MAFNLDNYLITMHFQVFGEELIDATSLKYISDDFIHLTVIGKRNFDAFYTIYLYVLFKYFYTNKIIQKMHTKCEISSQKGRVGYIASTVRHCI